MSTDNQFEIDYSLVLAERVIRTLHWRLLQIHENGERNLTKALKAAVEGYNNSIHLSHNLTPLEAEEQKNYGVVLNNLQEKRDHFLNKYWKAYNQLNKQFDVGDIVRYKLPALPFTKEARQHFSSDRYRIVKIIHTHPVKSYKIAELDTGAIVPGSFMPEQLLLA